MKNERNDLVWEEIKSKHLIQNKWMDLRESAFRFPDGTTFEPYYNYSRKDYVVIVPFDENGNLICVRQYRQGIHQVTVEFPAGGIESPDGKEYWKIEGNLEKRLACEGRNQPSETALETAQRELLEETGYKSENWTHLITMPSNATLADNYANVYMAKNCRKVSGQDLDDTEFLNVEIYTPDEIEKMIFSGEFQQCVHVMAWLLSNRK